MKNGKMPDPDTVFPVTGTDSATHIRPTLTRNNIEAGEFSYYSGKDFEARVTHHYDWNGDKLIIGKFCQIAAGVEFIMNGANHQMNAVSTYPFYIMEGWEQPVPPASDMPLRGDTVVGNDVWIGEDVTVLPGVHIGDGAIIGAKSVVGSDVEPYTIVAGDPARLIRRRFDAELTELMLRLKWWDLPSEEIQELIPLLSSGDLEYVKKSIYERLNEQ